MDRFLTQFGPLAWPLATLLLALIFRRDVGEALGRVGRVKYRDLELTFRDDLHEAEQLARSIPAPDAKGPVVLELANDEAAPIASRLIIPADRRDPLDELASRRPREAVGAAWALVARASKAGPGIAPAHPDLEALVGRLRALRDRAARADQPPPSPEEARRFVDLARRVASRIGEAG